MEQSSLSDIQGVISGHSRRAVFYPDYETLGQVIKGLKDLEYKIVMTNGVFDMIHEGHVKYLEAASAHGLLVVGVDTDELTQQRKGPKRPLVKLDERLLMLATQRCVSILSLVKVGDDPDELLKVVRPDVLVVSSSTKDVDEEKIGRFRSICGEVVILPPQSSGSTTSRMRELAIEGAEEVRGQLDLVIQAMRTGVSGPSGGNSHGQ